MVATETYKPDDADMSVQIGRINAARAGAIVKMGQGGSTVTAANNIKQLGLDKMLLLASIHNFTVFRARRKPRGALCGAGVHADADRPRRATPPFLVWQAKYNDADPYGRPRLRHHDGDRQRRERRKDHAGPAVRDAIEAADLPGRGGSCSFPSNVGIVRNPFFIGTLQGGKLVLAK